MLLAIDTSTNYASVALVQDDRALVELNWDVGQRHSMELLQRLSWLFSIRELSPSALDGVAVAIGPGSFNGVRVAVATAKSLAFALDIPLYGHATLDAIAWGRAEAQGPVWAVLEAGRGQVYAAAYAAPASTAQGWGPVDGYHIVTPVELAEQIRQPVLFCGEWRAETRAALEGALGQRARFASMVGSRRATWLAELALARAARGEHDDPASLEALYLRRPAITTSTKVTPIRQQAREENGSEQHELGGEGASRALRG